MIDGIHGLGLIEGNGCDAIYVSNEDFGCHEELWNEGAGRPGGDVS
jgi:hypothetical protein